MDFDRRTLLRAGTAGIAASLGPWWASTARAHGSRLFTLGVASGDPTARLGRVVDAAGAVAAARAAGWARTRCRSAGRWPPTRACGRWSAEARRPRHAPAGAHTVHVTVDGLDPDRWYYYRFFARGEDSPIGRTRTFPARHDACRAHALRAGLVPGLPERLLQRVRRTWPTEDLDFVVHVGDYIYEDGTAPAGAPPGARRRDRDPRRLPQPPRAVPAGSRAAGGPRRLPVHRHLRRPRGGEQLRRRRSPRTTRTPPPSSQRRANAYQAYYEHLPLRDARRARGATRSSCTAACRFGQAGRPPRARHPPVPHRPALRRRPQARSARRRSIPAATMTGAEQERWLLRGPGALRRRLERARPAGDVDEVGHRPGHRARACPFFNMDAWDGYVAARQRLLDFLADARPLQPGRPDRRHPLGLGRRHPGGLRPARRPASWRPSSSPRRSPRTSRPPSCRRCRPRCPPTRTSGTSRALHRGLPALRGRRPSCGGPTSAASTPSRRPCRRCRPWRRSWWSAGTRACSAPEIATCEHSRRQIEQLRPAGVREPAVPELSSGLLGWPRNADATRLWVEGGRSGGAGLRRLCRAEQVRSEQRRAGGRGRGEQVDGRFGWRRSGGSGWREHWRDRWKRAGRWRRAGRERATHRSPERGGETDGPEPGDMGGPACNAGATRCTGAVVEVCTVAGAWVMKETCAAVCTAGACAGMCTPEQQALRDRPDPRDLQRPGRVGPGPHALPERLQRHGPVHRRCASPAQSAAAARTT